MPELPEPYLPSPDGPFPGLSSADAWLCKAYLRKYGDTYLRLYWNIRVGVGIVEEAEKLEEPYRTMAIQTSQMRIDMVGVPKDREEWDLIEYRIDAGAGAIGSLMCYRYLWPAEWHAPMRMILVTDIVRRDIAAVAEFYDINIVKVIPEY